MPFARGILAKAVIVKHIPKLTYACLLSACGWMLMWAHALFLFRAIPLWLTVAAFFAGLLAVPFCIEPKDRQ